MTRRRMALLPLLVAVRALTSCGAEEERTIATWAELRVIRDGGATEDVHLEARGDPGHPCASEVRGASLLQRPATRPAPTGSR